MRRTFFLAFMLLLTAAMTAAPVHKKRAMLKAKQFAFDRHKMRSADVIMAYSTTTEEGEPGLFVFNIGRQEGFVIVANDDSDDDNAIIGYADEGHFDADNMPENMRAWLNHCTATVAIKQANVSAAKKAKQQIAVQRTTHPTDVIEPLITTAWGQWPPFNDKCPTVNGVPCPTGCTATAMAQVMRYHQHPTNYCSAIPSYVTRTTNMKIPALPATTFNWDLMPDEITEDTPQECINEVAKLMRYCGQATNMNYSSSGSGAYTYRIPERLPLYFDYSSTIHYEYRESYDEESWDSLLVSELLNKRPVIYTAYTNLEQGHTFICDGYDGKGFYHINWGWVGVGNGYFRISEAFAKDEGLNPNVKNYHLSMDQTALTGIKATGDDEYTAPANYFRAFSRPSLKYGTEYRRETTDANFTGITLSQSFINTTSVSKNLPHGLALFDESGNIEIVLASTTASLASGDKKTYEVTNLAFGKGLADGHYTIKSVYKTKANGNWIAMGGTDRNYIDVTIDNHVMTLTPMPRADFVVEDVRVESPYLLIDFNNIQEEFYGPIYLRKRNTTTNGIDLVAQDVIAFDALSSRTFELYIGEQEEFSLDTDTYFLSVDEYDTQYFYTNEQVEKSLITKTADILNLNTKNATIYGDRIMCQLTITNNGEQDYCNTFALFMVGTDGGVEEVMREMLELAAGQTITKYIEIPLAETDFGRSVSLKMSHLDGDYCWTNDITDPYLLAKGAIYWTKDGTVKTKEAAYNFKVPNDAVAINIRNASNRITANSNPNTIYMLGTGMPKGLTGKNMVDINNRGTKLTLTDGYDYFFPVEMSFSGAVTYQRALSDSDSIAWTTLSLPFKPSEVTIDGNDVKWSESKEDADGTMWLIEMASVSDTTIVTSFAQGIEANTPYLLAYADSLVDKVVTFTANGYTFAPTQTVNSTKEVTPYTWHGTSYAATPQQSYILKDKVFIYSETGEEVPAFGTYLTCDTIGSPAVLAIDLNFEEEKTDTIPIDDPTEVKRGDVNKDGDVNVGDVMVVVDYLLGKDLDIFVFKAADLDKDEVVDITDMMLIVNIILGKDVPDNEDNNGDNPPSDDNGDNPPSDDNGDNPPSDDNGDNPPSDDNGENPPSDDNGDNPPSDDNGENPPSDDNGDNPPSDDNGDNPPSDDNGDNPPSDDNGDNTISEGETPLF